MKLFTLIGAVGLATSATLAACSGTPTDVRPTRPMISHPSIPTYDQTMLRIDYAGHTRPAACYSGVGTDRAARIVCPTRGALVQPGIREHVERDRTSTCVQVPLFGAHHAVSCPSDIDLGA